jgi:hypothetical protein
MTSTRRQDVFTKNTNPLYKIYKPAKPDHEPPQYFPVKGRRQIYDFLQSKVNVHMKFGMHTFLFLITVCLDHMTPEDNLTSTQRTMRTVRNEHYPEALKQRIEQGETIKSTHNVKKISFSKCISIYQINRRKQKPKN